MGFTKGRVLLEHSALVRRVQPEAESSRERPNNSLRLLQLWFDATLASSYPSYQPLHLA